MKKQKKLLKVGDEIPELDKQQVRIMRKTSNRCDCHGFCIECPQSAWIPVGGGWVVGCNLPMCHTVRFRKTKRDR